MTLAKEIPSQAGMGGGSSDAAAVLRGLAALYKTGDSPSDLAAMGASLGADIPFCVAGGAPAAKASAISSPSCPLGRASSSHHPPPDL